MSDFVLVGASKPVPLCGICWQPRSLDGPQFQIFEEGAWKSGCRACWEKAGAHLRFPSAFVVEHFGERLGPESHQHTPGYSSCGRCLTSWPFVPAHTTMFGTHSGIFALCEMCWRELTPRQRLPYYRQLFATWKEAESVWERIELAVLYEE